MKYILDPATFPPSPIYHYPAQITTLCCVNHEGKYQTNPCFLLSPSSVYSLSSQHKLFKMLSQAMQLLVSSKPSTAPHRHLKYIPLPPPQPSRLHMIKLLPLSLAYSVPSLNWRSSCSLNNYTFACLYLECSFPRYAHGWLLGLRFKSTALSRCHVLLKRTLLII